MSCYPSCQVPEFLLPKELRDKTRSNCIGMSCRGNCTKVELHRVKQRRENCFPSNLTNLMRCTTCQRERKRQKDDEAAIRHDCWAKHHFRNCVEIPFIWKPPYEPIKFIGNGYTNADCFPQNEIQNPCKVHSEQKKKMKKLIKDLSKHYYDKVTAECDHPVENYIRMNLSNIYHPCGMKMKPAAPKTECATPPTDICGCLKGRGQSGH